MPMLEVRDKENQIVGETEFPEAFIADGPNDAAVYYAVIAARAARRQGTHKTKTRGEVAGSGAKPWRQKGTGRARAGSRKSPLWGGGTVFGPEPRSHRKKCPRKVRALAFRSLMKEKLENEAIMVLSDFDLSTPKTKEAVRFVEHLNLKNQKTLAITAGNERNFFLACRNLVNVRILRYSSVDLLSVLESEIVLFSEESLKLFKERQKNG